MASYGSHHRRPSMDSRQSSDTTRLRFAQVRTESPMPLRNETLAPPRSDAIPLGVTGANGDHVATARQRRPIEREEDVLTAAAMRFFQNRTSPGDQYNSGSFDEDEEPPAYAYDLNDIYTDDSDEEDESKVDNEGRAASRQKISFNVCSYEDNKKFLVRLARAMLAFGSPSHRIEAHLHYAAKVLRVNGSFTYFPGNIICSFRDRGSQTGETHYVKGPVTAMALGKVVDLHGIYRAVTHDELPASIGADRLEALLVSPPEYGPFACIGFTAIISAILCPMAFGGSIVDTAAASTLALVLAMLQTLAASKSKTYADVFEITSAAVISGIARGLSAIRIDHGQQIFCYTAITSASVCHLIPGPLILHSGLEIASKKMLSGSVKLVYALIFSLFLGFGLQIGSYIALKGAPMEQRYLRDLAQQMMRSVTYDGSLIPAKGSHMNDIINGTWTFTNVTSPVLDQVIKNCHRMENAPWWLSPVSTKWWDVLFIPVFALVASLASQQPWRRWVDLSLMVAISCMVYTLNIVLTWSFDRPDVIASINSFAVGVIGNIVARSTGKTAYALMVGGIGFLIPGVFAETGGITGEGSGIDIGGKILEVTVGITVGLFMSQTLVYALGGAKKGAAAWSF